MSTIIKYRNAVSKALKQNGQSPKMVKYFLGWKNFIQIEFDNNTPPDETANKMIRGYKSMMRATPSYENPLLSGSTGSIALCAAAIAAITYGIYAYSKSA